MFSGQNCSIIAYGHTGSGKTHTMYGDTWPTLLNGYSRLTIDGCGSSYEMSMLQARRGLVLSLAEKIFENAAKYKRERAVFVKYFQIYNEKICDLFSGQEDLPIQVDSFGTSHIENISDIQITTYIEFLLFLQRAESKRIVASTPHNLRSSRSHTILEFEIKSDTSVKYRLTLCDLAGSEKLDFDQVRGKLHQEESKNINRSLTSLTR